MLVYLFPGQGAQTRGMGKEVFDEFPELVAEANGILGYSIKQLCLEDPEQQLQATQYTQPALYTVNALTYYKKLRETKQKPDYVAGHSLGEYNALLAGEAFDFATGLRLVKKRGELMSTASGGAMAAIIGLSSIDIKTILTDHALTNVTIANYNSHLQSVISGLQNDIEKAQQIFSNIKSATFIMLKVSGAFHSSLMATAQQQFATYLESFEFSTPTIPVINNIDASAYHPAIIKKYLANQITHPVQWVRTIEFFIAHEAAVLEEVGPGNVLSGLVRRIRGGQ